MLFQSGVCIDVSVIPMREPACVYVCALIPWLLDQSYMSSSHHLWATKMHISLQLCPSPSV